MIIPLRCHRCNTREYLDVRAYADYQAALDKTLKRRVRQSRQGLPFGVTRQAGNSLKPYKAHIRENGKLTYLGGFATVAEAAAVAASARESRATRIRVEIVQHPGVG